MQRFAFTRRRALAGLATFALVAPARADGLPEVAVTKDPSCGCCEAWVAHLRQEGFRATVTEGPVNPLKAKLGVPRALASCHTAQVGGYVIEGHLPACAIKRFWRRSRKASASLFPACRSVRPAWRSRASSPIRTTWSSSERRSAGPSLDRVGLDASAGVRPRDKASAIAPIVAPGVGRLPGALQAATSIKCSRQRSAWVKTWPQGSEVRVVESRTSLRKHQAKASALSGEEGYFRPDTAPTGPVGDG